MGRVAHLAVYAGARDPPSSANALVALDWNHDFRTDIVMAGRGGLRLLLQDEKGGFADATRQSVVWGAASRTMPSASGPQTSRWTVTSTSSLARPRAAVRAAEQRRQDVAPDCSRSPALPRSADSRWADLDQDADADAMFLDGAGTLHVFTNRQAGQFCRCAAVSGVATVVAATVADIDADGAIDHRWRSKRRAPFEGVVGERGVDSESRWRRGPVRAVPRRERRV